LEDECSAACSAMVSGKNCGRMNHASCVSDCAAYFERNKCPREASATIDAIAGSTFECPAEGRISLLPAGAPEEGKLRTIESASGQGTLTVYDDRVSELLEDYQKCDDIHSDPAPTPAPDPSPAPSTVENTNETCSDGIDNDGDGYVDCEDYNCSKNANVTVCKIAACAAVGDGKTFDSKSWTCDSCWAGSCCSPSTVCANDVVCGSLIECIAGCSTSACEQQCRSYYPSAVAKYNALVECLASSCESACQ
jgi:hypothetical protein